MSKPLVVVKVGTATITHTGGEPNEEVIAELARQLAVLHPDHRLVLVSSGAVGAGKRFVSNYSGTLTHKKVAAAVGNPLLMNLYSQHFAPYNIHVAQALLERHHFDNRKSYLQLKETFEGLWDADIIPIANENDVVNNHELKFSDNDELATLIAVAFDADKLLLGTSVAGLLDKKGKIVKKVVSVDDEVLGLATKETSATGLGGMTSKLSFARLATKLGVDTVIFGAREAGAVLKAYAHETGTFFHSKPKSPKARKRWLAGGAMVRGKVIVDAGAAKAILRRKSLLAVGITGVMGSFKPEDIVEISDSSGKSFAVAKIKISAAGLKKTIGLPGTEVAHADHIVLMD